MAVDKFSISSAASVLVGGSPIVSFEDESTESIVAAQLWDSTVESLFIYRWRFATYQAQLSRHVAPPMARWESAYQLPGDVQLINAVTIGDSPISFDRYNNLILCDAQASDEVIADVTVIPAVAYWPGYFKAIAEVKMAARMAVPIADDLDKASYYEKEFLRLWAQGKNVDAQGRTAVKMPVGGLARYHGGRA
jgi:hypothetical protein